jgi:hypothetical protein
VFVAVTAIGMIRVCPLQTVELPLSRGHGMAADRVGNVTSAPLGAGSRRRVLGVILGVLSALAGGALAQPVGAAAKFKIKNKDRNANKNDSRSNARVNELPRAQQGSRARRHG